jgi:hypothetical protein
MLEAILVPDDTLQMKLGRVSRHNELQRNLASHWDYLRKKRTESAFGDLVATPFDVTLAEADPDR